MVKMVQNEVLWQIETWDVSNFLLVVAVYKNLKFPYKHFFRWGIGGGGILFSIFWAETILIGCKSKIFFCFKYFQSFEITPPSHQNYWSFVLSTFLKVTRLANHLFLFLKIHIYVWNNTAIFSKFPYEMT